MRLEVVLAEASEGTFMLLMKSTVLLTVRGPWKEACLRLCSVCRIIVKLV